jgi:murein DD-endopeptidase MepM/ murein hydrolase activator NlpD
VKNRFARLTLLIIIGSLIFGSCAQTFPEQERLPCPVGGGYYRPFHSPVPPAPRGTPNAADIHGARVGTPVYAPVDGVILWHFSGGDGGLFLRMESGTYLVIGHLTGSYREGETREVRQGERIAELAHHNLGPHAHFAIWNGPPEAFNGVGSEPATNFLRQTTCREDVSLEW